MDFCAFLNFYKCTVTNRSRHFLCEKHSEISFTIFSHHDYYTGKIFNNSENVYLKLLVHISKFIKLFK